MKKVDLPDVSSSKKCSRSYRIGFYFGKIVKFAAFLAIASMLIMFILSR